MESSLAGLYQHCSCTLRRKRTWYQTWERNVWVHLSMCPSVRLSFCGVLLELPLSDLLCLHIHSAVTKRREREREEGETEVGFRCFYAKSARVGKRERSSWGQFIFWNAEGKRSVIRELRSVGEDSFNAGQRDYHADPSLLTSWHSPYPSLFFFPRAEPLMCIDWLVLT